MEGKRITYGDHMEVVPPTRAVSALMPSEARQGFGDLPGCDEPVGNAGDGIARDRETDPRRGPAELRVSGREGRDADHLTG